MSDAPRFYSDDEAGLTPIVPNEPKDPSLGGASSSVSPIPDGTPTFSDADAGLHHFTLADTWPARLLKSLYGAARAPGDALQNGPQQMPQSGTWTDEDEARAQLSQKSLNDRTTDMGMFFGPTAPGALTTRAGESSIPLLNPKPAIPQINPAAETISAAQRQEIPLPRVAMAPPWMQKVGAGLSDAPIIGMPLNRAASNSLNAAESALGKNASDLGIVSREEAGGAVQNAVQRFKSDVIPQLSEYAYKPINEAMPAEAQFPADMTSKTLDIINGRLAQSNGKLTGEAARVADAVKNGPVTYQGLQDLRSALGKQMNDPLNRQGYDDFADSYLYRSLSQDMRNAVKSVGGDDLASKWDAANSATAKNFSNFSEVKRFGNDSASPNATFQNVLALAMDKRGDIGKLQNLKDMASPKEWGNVSATALDAMARDNNNNFSMPSFVNNYNRMTPEGRSVLFGDASKSVDDLANVYGRLQQIDKFKSKSQSANVLALGGMGTAFWAEPFSATTAAITGFAGSKWLAQPATAKAYSNLSQSYLKYAMRPSEGLAREVNQRASTFGVMLSNQIGIPQAANDISGTIMKSLPVSYPSAAKSAAEPNQNGGGPTVGQ